MTHASQEEVHYRLCLLSSHKEELIATENMFRAVIVIGNDAYKVGNDWPTSQEAFTALCFAVKSDSHRYFIYDDKGENYIDKQGFLTS